MSINGREGRKRRDRSKRIHFDIQDKIRRQAPDIIAQLWDKTHLGNLDIQAETVIKQLETVFLLGLLTSLTNQS
jgi:hypothetical protein